MLQKYVFWLSYASFWLSFYLKICYNTEYQYNSFIVNWLSCYKNAKT